MTLRRMDNVGVVFDDLEAGIAFFSAIGMELEGRAHVGGAWVDGLIGVEGADVDIAMMRTADGHSRIELSKFHAPEVIRLQPDPRPVNALGLLRMMFTVDDIDDTVARLQAHGAELMGNLEQYENVYRLCYMRGPEGVIVGLAEELGGRTNSAG